MTSEHWERTKQILEDGLKLAPEKRAAFLESACGGDSELRGEVESLIASHEEAGSQFLGVAAPDILEITSEFWSAPSRAGESVGPYKIIEETGRGGMGVVYKAEDTRLRRFVALKFLPEEVAKHPRSLTRFRREAQAASALNHPNICTVYDIGQHGTTEYLVMELLEGETLAARLLKGALPPDRVMQYGIEVADALDAAHRRGIVHRDLKPGNIFVTARGECKVLDFGLAKLGERTAHPDAATVASLRVEALTNPGTAMGTVSYMSPEQVLGLELDARTDLFSLGVVLYEMVTGVLPFPGQTSEGVFDAILHSEPAAPIRIKNALPKELQRIINKALEKDRNLRYRNSSEIRTDLQRLKEAPERHRFPKSGAHLGDQPQLHGAARPATAERKRTAIWAVGTVMVLAMLLASSVLLYRNHRGRALARNTAQATAGKRLMLAVLPFQNFTGDPAQEYVSDGFTEEMISQLGRLNHEQVGVIARTSSMTYKGSTKPVAQIGRELAVDYLVEGSLRRWGDHVRITTQLLRASDQTPLWSEDYDRTTRDVVALQGEVAQEIAHEIKISIAPQIQTRLAHPPRPDPEAYGLYLRGRSFYEKDTSHDLLQAVDLYKQAINKDPGFAPPYSGLGVVYLQLEALRVLPAHTAYPQAETAAKRATELDPSLAEPYAVLGVAQLNYEWNWPAAEKETSYAIQLDPNDAYARTAHSNYLLAIGSVDAAVAEINIAQRLDPVSPSANAEFAAIFYFARQYDKAAEQCRRALELDPRHPMAHLLLAASYGAKGMDRQGFDQWLEYLTYTGDKQFAADLRREEARFGFARARRLLSQKSMQHLREQSQYGYVPAMEIARAYLELGDRDQTIQWLRTAYEQRASGMALLNRDPGFDALRSDPRFEALVHQIGLP